MSKLAILLAVISLQGCSLLHDPRDAPWDPKAGSGRALIDQIPAWEGAANRVCCGHLRSCEPHQTPRC